MTDHAIPAEFDAIATEILEEANEGLIAFDELSLDDGFLPDAIESAAIAFDDPDAAYDAIADAIRAHLALIGIEICEYLIDALGEAIADATYDGILEIRTGLDRCKSLCWSPFGDLDPMTALAYLTEGFLAIANLKAIFCHHPIIY